MALYILYIFTLVYYIFNQNIKLKIYFAKLYTMLCEFIHDFQFDLSSFDKPFSSELQRLQPYF